MSSPVAPAPISRSLHLALFVTGLLWLLAGHAAALRGAEGIAARLRWGAAGQDLLSNIFLLFLLAIGFAILDWIGTRRGGLRRANALPQRPTTREEWTRGVIIGWAIALAAIVPMMIAGALRPQFSWTPQSWATTAISILSLAAGTLAIEIGFRGFLFRRLIDAVGPTTATLLLSAIYALLGTLRPNVTGLGLLVTIVGGVLFSIAYLRTHALWLGWGMHFAWAAVVAIVLGLPVGGVATYSGVVQSDVVGPEWLTGGAFGPEGAFFTGIVFLAAIALVFRATRNYAWNYTHPVIVSGGYPMDVAPPPAHAAMEQAEAAKPTLVQIAPAPSSNGAERPPSSEAAHHQ